MFIYSYIKIKPFKLVYKSFKNMSPYNCTFKHVNALKGRILAILHIFNFNILFL